MISNPSATVSKALQDLVRGNPFEDSGTLVGTEYDAKPCFTPPPPPPVHGGEKRHESGAFGMWRSPEAVISDGSLKRYKITRGNKSWLLQAQRLQLMR